MTSVNTMSDMKYFCEKADYLLQHYHCNLGVDFTDEIITFFELLKMDKHQEKTMGQMLKYIIAKKLAFVFPNIRIAFRIYLSISWLLLVKENVLMKENVLSNNEKSKKLFKIDNRPNKANKPCSSLH